MAWPALYPYRPTSRPGASPYVSARNPLMICSRYIKGHQGACIAQDRHDNLDKTWIGCLG